MGYTREMKSLKNLIYADMQGKEYHMEIEKVGNVTATTLYKNGKIVLYEETIKEVRKIPNYGDFEVTKVLKRIHFDENGSITEN